MAIRDASNSKKDIDSLYLVFKEYSDIKDTLGFKKELKKLQNRWDSVPTLTKGHIIKRIGFFYYENSQFDSAYFYFHKARNTYLELSDTLRAAKVVMNMAVIKKNLGDNIGAEELALEALKTFDKYKDLETASGIQNTLGNIYSNINAYSLAKHYLKKAINTRKTLADSSLKYSSINNLALVYHKTENYNKAIHLFQDVLIKNNFNRDSSFYALVSDNLLYSKLKAGYQIREKDFLQILSLKEKYNSKDDIVTSYLHLAEFFKNKNKLKSIQYVETALNLSEKHKINDSRLEAMGLLSEIYEPEKALKISKLQISLLDSISKVNRLRKEKISRIAYETDKKAQENKKLKVEVARETKQKWRLLAAFLFAIIGVGTLMLLYKKNKKQKDTIEALQKELHHRVKNNLSVIDTFIEVTKDEFNDPKVDTKLTELQNRIDSINAVHLQLYQNDDVTNLNFKNYINKLVQNVASSFSKPEIIVTKDIADSLKVSPSQAFPIGLIINEFLTNSYKYAFDDNKGQINITLNEKDKGYSLKLSDNGKGLPKDFDLDKTDSFGLRIIHLLSKQLNGTFNLESNNCLILYIDFPKAS